MRIDCIGARSVKANPSPSTGNDIELTYLDSWDLCAIFYGEEGFHLLIF